MHAVRYVGVNENRHKAVSRRHQSISIGIAVLRVTRFVIFVVQVENRAFVFFTLNLAVRLVAAIVAVANAIAKPFVRDALLVRHTFELIVVAKLAVFFILAVRTIANVIASEKQAGLSRKLKSDFN